MRRRPSSRLLVLSPDGRILLFYFEHASGPLAGKSFWATPGGVCELGENYETAARRELREEVNPLSYHMGAEIARREFLMQMPDCEEVLAKEAYFFGAYRRNGAIQSRLDLFGIRGHEKAQMVVAI